MKHYLLMCECENIEDGFVYVPLYLAAGMKLIERFADTVTGNMVVEKANSMFMPVDTIFGLVVREFKDGVPIAGTTTRIERTFPMPTAWE